MTITTTAQTDAEAFALLDALGMPFSREGRPAGFESLERPGHRGLRNRERNSVAKTSQIVRAARPAKFKTRAYTRCRKCGRPRAVYRKFGLCRICLREMAHQGYIPGMTKSSW